jgi:hypothetical protein
MRHGHHNCWTENYAEGSAAEEEALFPGSQMTDQILSCQIPSTGMVSASSCSFHWGLREVNSRFDLKQCGSLSAFIPLTGE